MNSKEIDNLPALIQNFQQILIENNVGNAGKSKAPSENDHNSSNYDFFITTSVNLIGDGARVIVNQIGQRDSIENEMGKMEEDEEVENWWTWWWLCGGVGWMVVEKEVAPFEKIHGLCPCMLAPTKIIIGLGLSLRINILIAFGVTVDCRILLTSKATTIARAILAPLQLAPRFLGSKKKSTGMVYLMAMDLGSSTLRFNIKSFSYFYDASNVDKRLMVICPLLNLQAIDDAGHDRESMYKVKELEAIDCAIQKLAKLLRA
ncbi:putative actin-depolymerizing factor 2-like [Capsicum annuum]|nr:putative actin-depolymerizing factor 2-like [Capsicum annuum]